MEYLTIGMHRYPVHERTYKKSGKEYPSYRVRLTKDIDPHTNRRIEEDITAPSIEKLEHKLRERLTPYDYLLNPHSETTPFSELIALWFAAGCTSWEPSTQNTYRAAIERYHLPLTRGLTIADLTPDFLQNLYQQLLLNGVSAATVRKINAYFASIFSFAVQRRYVFSNPCTGLYVPRPIFRLQEALSVGQQQRLLAACVGTQDEYLVQVLLSTGMRISEALGLTWDNVDFESGCVRITATLVRERHNDRWHYQLRPYNKNRRHRAIYLSASQMLSLRQQKERQQADRALAGSLWQPILPNLVFTDGLGNPLAYNTVEKRFKRLVNTLGDDMAHVHLHTLRHTAASNFYHETKDVLLTKEFLGHSDVRTTELYTHSRQEDLIAIAQARDVQAQVRT